MILKMRGLGVAGAIVLAVGLYLAFAKERWLYPGLIIVVGCICLTVFLLLNEIASPAPAEGTASATEAGRPPQHGQHA